MRYGKTSIIAMVLLGSVGCDQLSKATARHFLEQSGTRSFLGDTLRLTYTENHGAFLGLGSSLPEGLRTAIFTFMVALGLVALLAWMLRAPKLTSTAIVALSLVVGGGLGNLIDRVVNNGGVIDFMNLGIGPLRTGIFNVADVWIVVGAALLLSSGALDRPDPDPRSR